MDINLLYKKVEGTLTPEEEVRFSEWIEASPQHRHYFESFERHFCERESYVLTDEMRSLARERFVGRLGQKSRRRGIGSYVSYLARIAAILVLGVIVLHLFQVKEPVAPTRGELVAESPQTNYAEAVSHPLLSTDYGVTLIDGEGSDIPYGQLDEWSKANGMQLNSANGLLSYVAANSMTATSCEVRYNEIVVDKGAEFSVRLSDGTQVWLNADSRLRYPVAFGTHGERRVFLRGEAYFDVATDSQRPFVVAAAGTDVKAYGTEFNVHARAGNHVRTTLVEGVVTVSIDGDTCHTRLVPGQTADVDLHDGSITLREEPVELYVGWKQGKYYFEATPLSELFAELSLWYDIEVIFTDESLQDEYFSGCLSRDLSLDKLLRILQETTYLTSHRSGRQLFVKRGEEE
jgi:ferric-dicitrate binding protein FerR (iron transport regulator)